MKTIEKSNKFQSILSVLEDKKITTYMINLVSRKMFSFSFFIVLFCSSISFAQESKSVDKLLEYKITSENAINELKQILGSDKEKLKLVLAEISEREKSGVVILSTKEYQPIKEKMDEFYKNKSVDGKNYNDSKIYIEKLYYKYTLVTDLINSIK